MLDSAQLPICLLLNIRSPRVCFLSLVELQISYQEQVTILSTKTGANAIPQRILVYLRLYSTAMQNCSNEVSRWAIAPMRDFCVANTNMLVSIKPCGPNAIDPTRTSVHPTRPQREQVEYRSRWVPSRPGSRWPCTFHVVCVTSFVLGSQRKHCFFH